MFGGINDSDRKTLILAGLCAGVTGIVYFFFKYLLYLVAPFLVGLLFAVLIHKPVSFMNRKFKIHPVIGTVFVIAVFAAVISFLLSYVGTRFVFELKKFIANYHIYYNNTINSVCDMCCKVDDVLGKQDGWTYAIVERNVTKTISQAADNMLPSLMQNSAGVISTLVVWGGGTVIAVTSVFFMIKDIDKMAVWVRNGAYSKWFRILFGKLSYFGAAYLKTQLVIMGITAVICTVAMYLIENGYPIMIGILIGLLDALPLFGTGTVLIPWTVIYLFTKKFYKAAVVFTAYAVCYVVREVLEPKMMGGHMGIPPLVMLVTMYIGVLLFGILGFVLGPAAYIIITEVISYLKKVI